MARFKVFLEYEGTRYSGWQVQKNARTIQGELIGAMKKVFKTEAFEFAGSGRTDAGVHALQQVAHLDVETMLAPEIIKMKVNDELPADINILEVEKTTNTFHARHDAVARCYLYQISRRRSALAKRFVWWIKDDLDVDRMRQAAQLFVGLKDLRSFTDDSPEEKSTKVLIDRIEMKEDGDLVLIRVHGSHFLWKLIRRIVGVVAEVGRGRLSFNDLQQMLKSTSNRPAEFTAPPSGLFLEQVHYTRDSRLQQIRPVMNLSPYQAR